MAFKSTKRSGVLAHPTSFESKYGIGDLGDGSYRFVDFLAHTNQTYWQVLPITPTGYADSPYQSFSSFAGNTMLIDPDRLKAAGLLTEADFGDVPDFPTDCIDYGWAICYKNDLLKKAYANYTAKKDEKITEAYNAFIKEHDSLWLHDYAVFMAIFEDHGQVSWHDFKPEIAMYTDATRLKWEARLTDEIDYQKFLQYLFFTQWFELKAYANSKGIDIIGDVPIFAADNSADVWSNKELFYLDEKGFPTVVAGVPPDYFAVEGQLWGNPLYDWDKCKETGYKYWFNRIEHTLKMVDLLRIDHFRAFESYWEIPFGSPNAIKGQWVQGPGHDFFHCLKEDLGDLPIIAEDLGIITEEVEQLRDDLELPGMVVLQFGFMDLDENNHLPHQFTNRSVCYTGTHDNDTTVGWYKGIDEEAKDKFRRYYNTDGSNPNWDLIRSCLASVSEIAIVPIQDILGQDENSRMNTPGTPSGNWTYRFKFDQLDEGTTNHLKYLTKLFGRNL